MFELVCKQLFAVPLDRYHFLFELIEDALVSFQCDLCKDWRRATVLFTYEVSCQGPQDNETLSDLVLYCMVLLWIYYELLDDLKTNQLLGDIRAVQAVDTVCADAAFLLQQYLAFDFLGPSFYWDLMESLFEQSSLQYAFHVDFFLY